MAETRTTSSTGGQKGVKLERFDLIPTGPLAELAEHYGVGASKYANHQWRNGYEWSKSYAAMVRHQNAFWAGYDYDVCSNDPEGCSHVDTEGRPFAAIREDACFNHTGSHHMAAVAWHAFCLLEFKDSFPEHDDRYKPPAPEPEEIRLDPHAMWVIPSARFVDLGFTTDEGFFAAYDEATTLTFTAEASDISRETWDLLVGPRHGARFSMSVETGDTEDRTQDALTLIHERLNRRD